MLKSSILLIFSFLLLTACNSSDFSFGAPPIVVSAISPSYSYYPGGAELTLTGENFSSGMSVQIGGASCENVVVQSSLQATCTAPSGVVNTHDLVVTYETRSTTVVNGFEFKDFTQVSTIAGTGVAGDTNGTGDVAQVGTEVNAFFFDSTLQKFIFADGSNHKIRTLDATNLEAFAPLASQATLSDLSGSGVAGNADGLAAAATFTSPDDFIKTNNKLYLLDTDWTVWPYPTSIKEISSIGTVTTVKSGLEGYGSAVWDGGDYIYGANCNLHTIEKIKISDWSVAIVAGSSGLSGDTDGIGGVARFNCPFGLVIDATYENLYIGDYTNAMIRKMNISTLNVTTLAGTGNSGFADNANGLLAEFNYPSKLAIYGEYLFVTDHANCKIRQVNTSTSTVTTVAGAACGGPSDGAAAVAQFVQPNGIAYHPTLGLIVGASDYGWEGGGDAKTTIRLIHSN